MPDLKLQDTFITPYPQAELNGELGLTSKDIAKAIDVPIERVNKKIKRLLSDKKRSEHFLQLNWHFHPYGIKSESPKIGRPETAYALNILAAKAFVAKYESKLGREYLNYLLRCEQVAEQQVPILKAAVEALTTPIKRKTRTGYTIKVRKPVIRFGLFGPICEVEETKKSYSDLAPHELAHYKIVHRQKVIAGLTKEQSIAISDYDNLFLLPQGSE